MCKMSFLDIEFFKKNTFRHKSRDRRVQEQHAGLIKGGMTSEKCMIINKNEEDEMEIRGFKRSVSKRALTYVGIVLTAGLLRLFFHWIPHWYLFATSSACPVTEADVLLVTEIYKEKHKVYYVRKLNRFSPSNLSSTKSVNQDDVLDFSDVTTLSVHFEKGQFKQLDKLLSFSCKKVTYIWNQDKLEFAKLVGLDNKIPSDVVHRSEGLSSKEQYLRRLVYGPNKIDVKESSIAALLFLEVLNPFYIFQIASFILWFLDNYYYYAAAIMVMSAFGIIVTVTQTRKNERNLRSTVHSSDNCTVIRKISDNNTDELKSDYRSEVISTEMLVPGDVLEIPINGCIMHCDAILLTGNCILNESMLTGESVPVTKTALPNISNLIYDPKEHGKHTLFCGTHVIQTRYFGNEKVLAVVVKTGFSTTKGSLVRSILYPPPIDFRFEKESYKFITLLAVIAGLGFIYTIVTKILRHVAVRDLVIEAFDLITIVVPPALPAAMTVGSFYAQIRLKNKQIFCISPRSINVSGSIDCVCFDKTGTLTEDGLDLLCIVPNGEQMFEDPVEEVEKFPYNNTLLCGLVSCHSLTIINKEIVGDPLDLKMFESTKWIMEEPEVADSSKFNMIFPTVLKPPRANQIEYEENLEDEHQIGIIRVFPFSSSLQRMGVIVRKLGGHSFEYYCKGSPEMLLNFVKKSTIPKDFSEVLEKYTQDGCRVIAIAHKLLKLSYPKLQKIQRETIECDLDFLGLIVLENRLKPETTPCIQILNEAQIRIIMVTGDNILTALSVARDCDIIKCEESVITVNVDNSTPPVLYYTLNNCKKTTQSDTSMLSNSASIASLDTVESQLQTVSTESYKTKNKQQIPPCNNYRFAMTGKVWAIVKDYYPDLVDKLVTRGTIFARMSPEQKQQLIQELQELGYYVAMCGDGANDCGALKAAHTGVSLSEAESSVASPFTSKNPNISCVLDVIKEGRAALVTSFGIFKYMAAYSLCQFISVLLLYSIDSNLTDMEFLYIDLCIISIFAFFFGRTEGYPGKLVKEAPLTSLMSLSPVLSLLLQVVIILVFQVSAFFYLKDQPWYVPFDPKNESANATGCLENFTIFTISSFQYIGLAVIFSKGKPYRKSIFSNYGFLITGVVVTAISIYLAVYPAKWLIDFFLLVLPPEVTFRVYLLLMAGANFILSMLVEYFVIDKFVTNHLHFKFPKSKKSRRQFLEIERELNLNTKWPTLSNEFKSTGSPDLALPICTTEIVIETDVKKDKNTVLDRLFHKDSPESDNRKYADYAEPEQVISVETSYKLGNNKNIRRDSIPVFYINDQSRNSLPEKFEKNNDHHSVFINNDGKEFLGKNATLYQNGGLEFDYYDKNNILVNGLPDGLATINDTYINLPHANDVLQTIQTQDDLFSSLPSENTLSSGSDTFQSFSPNGDLSSSHQNISELPYDYIKDYTASNYTTPNKISKLRNSRDLDFEMNNFDHR